MEGFDILRSQTIESKKLRKTFSKIPPILDIPNLLNVQTESYKTFLQEEVAPEDRANREDLGLQSVFNAIFPIENYGEKTSLEFVHYSLGQKSFDERGNGLKDKNGYEIYDSRPKHDEMECRLKGYDYTVSLYVTLRLVVLEESGDDIRDAVEQDVYFGEIPKMTRNGSFIIGGAERVIVNQIHRSPGVLFNKAKVGDQPSGRTSFVARVIPHEGRWLDFDFDSKDFLNVRIDRRKKFPVTLFLKALGCTEKEIMNIFYDSEAVVFEKDGSLSKEINPRTIVYQKSTVEIKNGNEVVLKRGRKFTKRVLEKLETLNIVRVPVDESELLEKRCARDVVNKNTGEVIACFGEKISEETLRVARENAVDGIDIFYIDDIAVPASIANTLFDEEKRIFDDAINSNFALTIRRDKAGKAAFRKMLKNVFHYISKGKTKDGETVLPQIGKDGKVVFFPKNKKSEQITPVSEESIESVSLENINLGEAEEIRDRFQSEGVETEVFCDGAIAEIYKKFRPTDPPSKEVARNFFHDMFFDPSKYRISQVGRKKLNYKLKHNVAENILTLTKKDIFETVKYLLELKGGHRSVDDIDHLGNRRVKTVGELIQDTFYSGLERFARSVKERIGYQSIENRMPREIVVTKVVDTIVKDFFKTGQLSQFMDQTNPLSEITHKRRLSALGPKGLSRERAGFAVRDVHSSHYGRICPVETPEGPNIGLISSISTYAEIDHYGFIRAPYRIVEDGRVTDKIVKMSALQEEGKVCILRMKVEKDGKVEDRIVRMNELAEVEEGKVIGRVVRISVKKGGVADGTVKIGVDEEDGEITGRIVSAAGVDKGGKSAAKTVVRIGVEKDGKVEDKTVRMSVLEEDGKVTGRIVEVSALEEKSIVIAQANAPLDDEGRFKLDFVSARSEGEIKMVEKDKVTHMDVSPSQLVSISASLIPFLEHDDANRALMGSNMQRQAAPLIKAVPPLVGTGLESSVAKDSGVAVIARDDCEVIRADAKAIVVKSRKGDGKVGKPENSSGSEVEMYKMVKFRKSNQGTCWNQTPVVSKGQKIKKGQVIADGPATKNGELALGKNVMVAFMPWGGYNFEDAILISERIVKDNVFTSVHIEEFECQARETKLGREEITRDIPNVSEDALKNLDESGIIRVGAMVNMGDILVGKISPKGEMQLSQEEKLLRAIFGDKAGDAKDTSLKSHSAITGTVIDVKVLTSRSVAEKDPRAKEIENREIEEIRQSMEYEVGILRLSMLEEVNNLLKGRKADSSIARKGKKIISKGDFFTFENLQLLTSEELKKIKVQPKTLEQRTKDIVEPIENRIKILEQEYEEKKKKLREKDDLPAGVLKIVKGYIAVKMNLQVGDKMAGRHGNKGVVSRILPQEDMPYMADGTPIDMVLNPLGVPSRMNVGQVLETHLGWASKEIGKQLNDYVERNYGVSSLKDKLKKIYGGQSKHTSFIDEMSDEQTVEFVRFLRDGIPVASPVFDGAAEEEIKDFMKLAGLSDDGKTILFDGRTGEPFDQKVTVGIMYMLKLHHLVEEKIHARSIGPYSLVTQQPLGGKAHFGGQRLGEMEVWALEAYGAAHTLQEFLTVKSDDVSGRTDMFASIVEGRMLMNPRLPESFNVLRKELQSLGLNIELVSDKDEVFDLRAEPKEAGTGG